jgi:hypothetical protein
MAPRRCGGCSPSPWPARNPPRAARGRLRLRMAIADDILQRLPPRPYDDVMGEIRTGDLILCSGDGAFSRLIRWATKSPWSHIAIAVRLDPLDKVMVMESVEKIGVRAVALKSFLTRDSNGRKPYPGRILLARHAEFEAKSSPQGLRAMADFAADRLGAPFKPSEITKIALRIAAGALNVRVPGRLDPEDAFICSEYVGKCLEAVDIQIPWDGRGFIAPCDFAADPKVDAIAQIARL